MLSIDHTTSKKCGDVDQGYSVKTAQRLYIDMYTREVNSYDTPDEPSLNIIIALLGRQRSLTYHSHTGILEAVFLFFFIKHDSSILVFI